MLASVVNLFNPSLVVVGGGVAQSGDQLLAAIRETVYRRSLPLATRELLLHARHSARSRASSVPRRWSSSSCSAARHWRASFASADRTRRWTAGRPER